MMEQTKIPAKLESIEMITEYEEYADTSYYGEHVFKDMSDCIDIRKYRHVDRNAAPYFRSQYYPHNPENWKHCSKEDIQKVIDEYGSLENADLQYALRDYDRLIDLYNGGWSYKYLRAIAFITLNPDESKHQTSISITSGGCGGIESDAGDDHFKEIYRDEIHDLSYALRSLGFTQEQIDTAVVWK